MNSMEQIAALPVGAVFRTKTAYELFPEPPYTYTKTSGIDLEYQGLFSYGGIIRCSIEKIFHDLDEEIEEIK